MKFRVDLQMKAAFKYLVEQFGARVPGGFLDDREQIRPAFANRLVYKHAMSFGDQVPQNFWQKLFSVYAGFLRQTSKTNFWSQSVEFTRYIRFRIRGKPHFRIMIYYLSGFLHAKKRLK